jgi:hypothetical protein
MTVNNNAMMASYASQINSNTNSNSKVQSQSGTWTDNSQSTSPDFSAIAQQFMALLDTNKSGSIDKTEFSQAAQAVSKNSANSTQVDNAFTKIDGNSDGQISSDEMLSALKDAITARAQTQKGHHHHHHHHHQQATTTPPDSAAALLTQSAASTQQSSPSNEMQKALFNKIMAAYGNTATSTGTTTNISA